MSLADNIKNSIDVLLDVSTPRTKRKLNAALRRARDIVEYIELHHTAMLEMDIEERERDREARAASKAGAK